MNVNCSGRSTPQAVG